MKKNILIGFFFSTMMTLCFYSCEEKEHGGQCQFTPDELSFLNFFKTSLDWDGNSIYNCDTIAFLFNHTDTIYPIISTSISGNTIFYNPSVRNIFGQTLCEFDERTGIYGTTANVFKEFIGKKASIEVSVLFRTHNTYYIDLTKPTDTATILGKTYNNVFKDVIPDSRHNDIKSAFFAKKYGFIKIEATDGKLLERLDLTKEEIRIILTDQHTN